MTFIKKKEKEGGATTNKTRTQNSMRNVTFSLCGYALTLILQLVGRSVFVNKLSSDYLGLGGLFSSVISLLALSELGVGTAMVYSLYKPIAVDDKEKIKSLLRLYKLIHEIIGCVVFVLGLLVTPFLQYLIKDMPDIPYIRLYFMLYVANSACSYFCTYKRSMIVCNQNEFISTTTTTVAAIITRLLQILVLIFTGNYLLYLIVMLLVTVGENLWISAIANKLYPFIREKDVKKLPAEDIQNLKKNIFAMFCHKFGNVVVNATDSLIISKILGLVSVGLFSNYNLVLLNLQKIYSKVFTSITASVGNLTSSSSKEHSKEVLNSVILTAFFIQSFVCTSTYVLFQDFIVVWVGEKYLLSDFTVAILVANMYISSMRSPVMVFRDTTGTFWNDRYKPVVESIVNLAVSIPLTYALGIAGVRLGTIISTLLVSFWIEAYVLFHSYFKEGIGKYLLKQAGFAALTVIYIVMVSFLGNFIHGNIWIRLLVKAVLCAVVPNVINICLFYRSDSFCFLKRKVFSLFHR